MYLSSLQLSQFRPQARPKGGEMKGESGVGMGKVRKLYEQ